MFIITHRQRSITERLASDIRGDQLVVIWMREENLLYEKRWIPNMAST